MISVYSIFYNIKRYSFNWQEALNNYSQIGEEVIITANQDEDNSFKILTDYCNERELKNIKIIQANFSQNDLLFDGKLKNFSLQQCTQPVCIGVDGDEFLCIRHKLRWYKLAEVLLSSGMKHIDAIMIPMINLWGDYRKMREFEYQQVRYKWYLHKRGLYRGVVNFAKLPDGKIDVDKSDTCELINSNGDLVNWLNLSRGLKEEESFYDYLENEGLFVFHTGYVDFQNTVKKNNEFWQSHWELRSGKPYYNLPLSVEEMEKYKTVDHGLKLWNE